MLFVNVCHLPKISETGGLSRSCVDGKSCCFRVGKLEMWKLRITVT